MRPAWHRHNVKLMKSTQTDCPLLQSSLLGYILPGKTPYPESGTTAL